MLVFGGCNVRGPLFRAAERWPREPNTDWRGVPAGMSVTGPNFFTFTVGEMIQAIDCYRGERKIPHELLDLCHMAPEWAPTPNNNPLNNTDVALVEPNTSLEIRFDGYFLNRGPVVRTLTPLKLISNQAKRLCSLWYNKGIVQGDATIRKDSAIELVGLIPADFPDRDLTSEVLLGAIGEKREMLQGLKQIADRLDFPVGVVLYTWAYLPDGRAVSWPAEFRQELVAATRSLDLPTFDPRVLVEEYGLAAALKDDLRHYTEQFMPVLAKPMIEFAIKVSSSSRQSSPRGVLA